MTVQPARSFECPRCSSPAGLHRRSLGGKRRPGGSPLSRPQPPEAVAEGQSLQGTVTRPRSVTEGDDRVCLDSVARPGGNITGFASAEYGMTAKSVELLKDVAPGVTRAAVL